jgi:excisionase family DNA binding protein
MSEAGNNWEVRVDLYGPLNPQQETVLRWISNGYPDGVMEGFTYKTVAVALQNRRLVVVSRRGGVWRAEVTDAGRFYVEHGRHRPRPEPAGRPGRYGVPTAAGALALLKEQEATIPREDRRVGPRSRSTPRRPDGSQTTSVGTPDRRRGPVRYRVIVSRVQVAERYVRAVDEQDAVRKVQEELARPYSFIGGWRTVDTDLDVVEAESSLSQAPGPLEEGGTMLLPLKQAAAHLGLSYSSLWQLVRGGEIDHVEIGSRRYISREALTAFIAANTRRGTHYPQR